MCGFTASITEPVVVASKTRQALDVTFAATEPGIYSGNLAVTYVDAEGNDAVFELGVSGVMLDASKWYVTFDNNSTKYVAYYLSSKDYPDVTWEKTIMKNIGLDFSIMKDRIYGSFDYFWNDVTNMLGYAATEGLSMFASRPINGGHIRRYGWDATLNTVNVVTPDFRWTSMLTLSHYNSIWKEQFPNTYFQDYRRQENEPVNALYFYRTDGIINSDKSNMPTHQPVDF